MRFPASVRSVRLDVEIDGRFDRIDLPARDGSAVRHFELRLPDGARLLRVGIEGRQVVGSPIVLRADPEPCPAPRPGGAPPADVCVLVPVHGAAEATDRCLRALLRARNRTSMSVVVVDDASRSPALTRCIADAKRAGPVETLERPVNGGFVAAVNTGLRHVGARDVVLLNSDTVVCDGWLDRLRAAAHARPHIGAANPLSNNAELLGIPEPMLAAPMPDFPLQCRIDRVLAERFAGRTRDLPSGVGFCWYLRADALAAAGLLDEALVESGYGEDTEYSVRLQRLGWTLVAALDTYVAHEGSRSFGASRDALARRNVGLALSRFPEHEGAYRRFLARQPLREPAVAVQRALLREGLAREAKLWLTDAEARARRRVFETGPDWSLLPEWRQGRIAALRLCADGAAGFSSLRYAWPQAREDLLRDLAAAGFGARVRETFAHWTPDAIEAIDALPGEREAMLVDASAYCPRRHAHDGPRARCGEPDAIAQCETCIDRRGALMPQPVGLAAWRACTRASLARGDRVRTRDAGLGRRLEARLARPVDRSDARDAAPPQVRPGRIAFVGVDDPGRGFALLDDLARSVDATGADVRLVVIGRVFDEARLARHACVELPGDFVADALPAALARLACDALGEPGFSDDGHVRALGARLGLPVLSRERLSAMVAGVPA